MKKYFIVGFPCESTVEMIPSTWLINKDTCFWPCGKERSELEAMIRKCIKPMKTWSQVQIKIYGGTNSFLKANQKVEDARYLSNIGSDSSDDDDILNKKRLSNIPIRYRNEQNTEVEDSQSLLDGGTNIEKENRQSSQAEIYTLPKPPPVPEEKRLVEIVHETDMMEGGCAKSPEVASLSQFLSERTESTQDETVLQKILKHLIELKNENKLLRNEMRKLREKVEMKLQVGENPQVAAAIGGIVAEEYPNLPLISIGKLHELEREITIDASKATSLGRFLCRGGGFNNPNSLTLVVMKRLMSRCVAMLFSLEGRQEKLKFSELNLFNVVIASVKIKYEDAETSTISTRIGKVLAGAADWDGNRIRKRKLIEEEQEIDKEN